MPNINNLIDITLFKAGAIMRLEEKIKKLEREVTELKQYAGMKPEYNWELAARLGVLARCWYDDKERAVVRQLIGYEPWRKPSNSSLTGGPFCTADGAFDHAVPHEALGHIRVHDGSSECPVADDVIVCYYDEGWEVGMADRVPWENTLAFIELPEVEE